MRRLTNSLTRFWSRGRTVRPHTSPKKHLSLQVERLDDREVPSVTPVGGYFQVNSTTSAQVKPVVATDPSGNYVVVWQTGVSGQSSDVYAQRFSAAGVAQGTEFKVNSDTGSDYAPSVSSDANGNFVIAWERSDSTGTNVFARQFSSTGAPTTPDFQINQNDTDPYGFPITRHYDPSVAVARNGQFVVSWIEYYVQEDTEIETDLINAQYYTAAAVPWSETLTIEKVENVYDHGDIGRIMNQQSAADAVGDFATTWWGSGFPKGDIYARAFNAPATLADNPTPKSDYFMVNTYTHGYQKNPAISMSSSGEFVVTWDGEGPGSNQGIFARLFNSNTTPVGDQFTVDGPSAGSGDVYSSVSMNASGAFVVSWGGFVTDPSTSLVYTEVFDSQGNPQSGSIQVSPTGLGGEYSSVALNDSGSFEVVWGTPNTSGAENVFAQMYQS